MNDVLIAGAGPAGLAAAIHAARSGARVTVFERNSQCGVKLLTTGGGHCNVANTRPAGEWPALFGRHGRFIQPALSLLPTDELLRWLDAMGQPCHCPDGFHYFPISNSARAVRDALRDEAVRLGARIELGNRIDGLAVEAGRVRGVTVDGTVHPGEAVIVATGGRSYPATGSTWDGCRFAEETGHRVAPAYPGLTGLHCRNLSPELAGLVLPDATAEVKLRGRPAETGRGELLLTHAGASGPAVLDLSASAAQGLETAGGVTLTLRWAAEMDAPAWLETFAEWRREKGAATIAGLLRAHMPQRLARWLCAQSGVPDTATAATLAGGQRDALAAALGGFAAVVTGGDGWERAMITRGGVSTRDIDPATMESRRTGGLYFAGETVDIDGPCGGYNLHWAFASGALAGAAAADQSRSESL